MTELSGGELPSDTAARMLFGFRASRPASGPPQRERRRAAEVAVRAAQRAALKT